MSKFARLQDLVASVPSDAILAIGGFQLSRVPVALLQALGAKGARRLHAITAPNPLALDILAGAGSLHSADCGFIGFQYERGFVIPPALKRALANGQVTLRQRDVYETIGDLRAAATKPLADFALIHAQRADAAGNLGIDDPYVDVLLAAASRRVLATAETVVERVDDPQIAGDRVAGVALLPGGAAPAACHGHYAHDADAIDALFSGRPRAPRQRTNADGSEHVVERVSSDACNSGSPDGSRSRSPDGSRSVERIDAYIVELARQVRDGEVIVTGLASAVPMLAIELARRTHAPRARYINCIGAVNPLISRALSTSVNPELLDGCEATIDLPDLFDLARAGGVDAMFFGAGQVDRAGRMNLSRIGPAESPRVRLPGPAGSPSMRSFVRRVLIATPKQTVRNLVDTVDVATSTPGGRNQETALITDLATWRLTAFGFAPVSLRPGVTLRDLAARTGFAFNADGPGTSPPPSDVERAILRDIDPEGLRFQLLTKAKRPGNPPGTSKKMPTDEPPSPSERVLHEG